MIVIVVIVPSKSKVLGLRLEFDKKIMTKTTKKKIDSSLRSNGPLTETPQYGSGGCGYKPNLKFPIVFLFFMVYPLKLGLAEPHLLKSPGWTIMDNSKYHCHLLLNQTRNYK